MGIEEMKTMKTQLMGCVQGQMGDLKNVDTKELGQAVDMIKDLSEAIYYCTITESMEKAEKSEQQQPINNINYYTTPYMNNKMYPDYYRDMEREKGYMYYPMYYNGGGQNGGNSSGGNGGNQGSQGNNGSNMSGSTSYYTEPGMNNMYGMDSGMRMRDPRQGRAAIRRRMYMEGKEMHKDTNSQLRELEAYLQELSSDITEMIKDASPEERATLHQKMTTLASKIS